MIDHVKIWLTKLIGWAFAAAFLTLPNTVYHQKQQNESSDKWAYLRTCSNYTALLKGLSCIGAMSLLSRSSLGCLVLTLALAATSNAQVTIGVPYTGPSFAGTATSSSASYNEVFTVPAANNDVLESFTLWYKGGYGDQTSINSIYAWNGSSTVGSALLTENGTILNSQVVNAVTFSNLGLSLTAGATYLLTTNTSGSDSLLFSTTLGTPSAYAYYMQPGYSFKSASSTDYFSATFDSGSGGALTPVPEKGTLIWGGLALCAALAVWQKRRSPSVEFTPTSA